MSKKVRTSFISSSGLKSWPSTGNGYTYSLVGPVKTLTQCQKCGAMNPKTVCDFCKEDHK